MNALVRSYLNYATVFVNCSALQKHQCCSDDLANVYVRSISNQLEQCSATSILSAYFCAQSCKLSYQIIKSSLANLTAKGNLCSDAEITVEISPMMLSQCSLSSLTDLGINRICVNPIKFSTCDKKNYKILNFFEDACSHYNQVSADVVFDNHATSLDILHRNLIKLVEVGVNHVTLHEQCGKPLPSNAINIKTAPSDHLAASDGFCHYEIIAQLLKELNFHRYELCNFARGMDNEGKHNKHLWEGKQFIGIGPSARGRICLEGSSPFDRYCTRCTYDNNDLCVHTSKLTRLEVMEEMLLLGLGTTVGISNQVWELISDGISLIDTFASDPSTRKMVDCGILCLTTQGMSIREDKLVVLNAVLIILFNTLQKSK